MKSIKYIFKRVPIRLIHSCIQCKEHQMYAYTTLHTFPTPGSSYIFVRNFCLPFSMTETEYKDYLQIVLGSKMDSTKVRFYDWGIVPPTFQTSSLCLSHEQGTMEGLPYDLSMTVQDIPAYIQFVQDLVALEKRRPIFTQYNPKSLTEEPEYVNMFNKLCWSGDTKGKESEIQGFHQESVFIDECASTTDHSSSFDTIEKIDVPAWCYVVKDNSIPILFASTHFYRIPVLFKLHVNSDMTFLRQVTEAFQDDLNISVVFQKSKSVISETLEYNFNETDKLFQSVYRGKWIAGDLHTFLAELIRKEGITLLELSNGTILRERTDGFWVHMLDQYGSSTLHTVSSIYLRHTTLIFRGRKTSEKLTKELEPYQAIILSDILEKVPAGLSLLQTFNMFQSKIITREQTIRQYAELAPPINEQTLDGLLEAFGKLEDSIPAEWNTFTNTQKEELQTAAFLIFLKKSYSDFFSEEYTNYCRARVLSHSLPIVSSMTGIAHMLDSITEWLMEGHTPLATKLLARFHVQLKVKPSIPLFRTIVGIFCDRCLEAMDGKKLSASEMWHEFQTFLRSDSDYPAYSTSQQSEFNETLTSLGFEQKRTAAGKIWQHVQRMPVSARLEGSNMG